MSYSLLWLAGRQGGICWSSQLPRELQVQWCLHWHPALLLPRKSRPLPGGQLGAVAGGNNYPLGWLKCPRLAFSSCNLPSKQEAKG